MTIRHLQCKSPSFRLTSVFDELGDINHDLAVQSDLIAKDRDIGITSDRDLHLVAVDDADEVVGAAWLSFNGFNFEFDVVVKSGCDGRGIGSALTDAMLAERTFYQDVNPESTMFIHVVSQRMRLMLESRGFVVSEVLGKDNLIMEPADKRQMEDAHEHYESAMTC